MHYYALKVLKSLQRLTNLRLQQRGCGNTDKELSALPYFDLSNTSLSVKTM